MENFNMKRDALFACLDAASQELKGIAVDQNILPKKSLHFLLNQYNCDNTNSKKNRLHQDITLNHMRGRESIFKKPQLPIASCLKPRKTPDYKINPHKWKKYSLSDVDISDQTNATAAMTFLNQLANKLETSTNEQMIDKTCNEEVPKIHFKKSSKIQRDRKALETSNLVDTELDTPKLRGTKVIMPEYVVGQKKIRFRKHIKAEHRVGQLKLSHLSFESDNLNDD